MMNKKAVSDITREEKKKGYNEYRHNNKFKCSC